MPSGGKIILETAEVEIDETYAANHLSLEPGPYVMLAVSDTGCGMDDNTKQRLFDPFFTTKEKGKGTGLGLSTVYGIVKQSGGGISVYSELEMGAVFRIYLPKELGEIRESKVLPAIPTQPTGDETILVVEDEEALRDVIRRSLQAAGYTVLTAADGEAAIQRSAEYEGDIQLLLTDIVMPKMSGRTLVEKLRLLRPSTAVLYMSGYTDDTVIRRGVVDEGVHFIGKPFTAGDLTLKVRQVLDENLQVLETPPRP